MLKNTSQVRQCLENRSQVLIEQTAYTNRWRQVSPIAKGVFALAGIMAAFVAKNPAISFYIAIFMVAVAVFGARIPLFRYLRVAIPPLGFLLVSTISLAISIRFNGFIPSIILEKSQFSLITQVCGRSLAGLTSLLFLALTTPLTQIIAMLRFFKTPDILLDIMVVCYRTLFVFSETIHETMTAQSARLGYATIPLSFRSLGTLAANLTVDVWQRSCALNTAAMSRNSNGSFRFMEQNYNNLTRDLCIALTAGICMIIIALVQT